MRHERVLGQLRLIDHVSPQRRTCLDPGMDRPRRQCARRDNADGQLQSHATPQQPAVELRPCGRTGRVKNGVEPITAHAEILEDEAARKRTTRIIRRKYDSSTRSSWASSALLAPGRATGSSCGSTPTDKPIQPMARFTRSGPRRSRARTTRSWSRTACAEPPPTPHPRASLEVDRLRSRQLRRAGQTAGLSRAT